MVVEFVSFLPAYNAAATLRRTVDALDMSIVDDVILVDDASTDSTIAAAHELGLSPITHDRNRGLWRQPEDLLPKRSRS